MTVGIQLTSDQVDNIITNLSVGWRNLAQQAVNISTEVNGQGDGQAVLEAAGYSAGDATTALAALSYLSTLAGVWFGTADQPADFNFDNQLSQYWGGA